LDDILDDIFDDGFLDDGTKYFGIWLSYTLKGNVVPLKGKGPRKTVGLP
jgi:hypothetical protein